MPAELLSAWLLVECEKRNLRFSEASRRAGVAPNTISAILNGQTPGLEVCKALAAFFGESPEYVLYLAGHIPHKPDFEVARLRSFARRIEALPPSAQEVIMTAAFSLLQAYEDLCE